MNKLYLGQTVWGHMRGQSFGVHLTKGMIGPRNEATESQAEGKERHDRMNMSNTFSPVGGRAYGIPCGTKFPDGEGNESVK